MTLPAQVKKDIKKAEKTFKDTYEVSEEEGTPPKEVTSAKEKVQEEGKKEEEAPVQDVTPAEPTPPVEDEGKEQDADYWKHKYDVLNGKYKKEVPALAEQNRLTAEQLSNVEQILAGLGDAPSAPELGAGEVYLTDSEIEDYGSDMIEVVKKAAREAVSPELNRLQAENEQLRGMLGQVSSTAKESARDAVLRALSNEVPGWEEQNTSEEFLAWLSQRDLYSGKSRQQLLSEAFDANNATRVVSIFKGFKAEHAVEQQASSQAPAPAPEGGQPQQPQVNMDTLVAPGAPAATDSSSAQSDTQTWTQQEIAAFYRDVQSGKFRGREKERDQIERAIFKAVNEKRIVY